MKRSQINGELDRLPPHSLESERGLLGSMLLDPNTVLPECRSRIPDPECFYDRRHALLYVTLCNMDDKRIPIDTITVQQQLRDSGSLEAFGGIQYLSSLPDEVPSSANVGVYLNILLEKYQLRRALQFCIEQQRAIYDGEGTAQEFLDGFEAGALKLRLSTAGGVTPIKDSVTRCLAMIERAHERPGTIWGLSTGFKNLDDMTGGLVNGEMIVIAGRPSLGKSSLAMNFVEHIAIDQKVPVAVYSLEMTQDSLIMRMLGSRARINMRRVTKGALVNGDFPKLERAALQVSRAPIYIDPTSGLTVHQLRARARQVFQQYGVKLIVVDYLQMCSHQHQRNPEQGIAEISTGLKNLAKELDIPVIAISQLSRDFEKDKKRKPRMSDLRASGQIEQDADIIGILYRDEDDDATTIPVKLMICKQRNGDTGDVHFMFDKTITRFYAQSPIAEADVPRNIATLPHPD